MGRRSIHLLLSALLKFLDDHLWLMYELLQLLSRQIKDMVAQHQIRVLMKLQYGDTDIQPNIEMFLNTLQLHRSRQRHLRFLHP
jgi:hypothetical protein